jgi:hypothetical protein
VNPYGPLYGSPEYSSDDMPILDPKTRSQSRVLRQRESWSLLSGLALLFQLAHDSTTTSCPKGQDEPY